MPDDETAQQTPESAEALFEITPGSLPPGASQIHPQHHDIYCWEAIYGDGTSLLEVEGDTLHHFADIELDRMACFVLHPILEGYAQYAVQLGGEKRLIFTRRRPIAYNPNTGEVSWTVWHILGYQQTIEGKNVKSLTYIATNGNSFMSDDDNEALGGEPSQEQQ